MDFTGPAPTQPTLTLTGLSTPDSLWQPGQKLSAVVVSVIAPDRVTLRIGDVLIEANTSWQLAVGQRLSLQVARENDRIVLRIVPESPQVNTPTATQRPAATLTVINSPPSVAGGWRVGQRLDAVVVSQTGQNKVTLQAGDSRFEALTTLVTSPGQRLTLQVQQTAQPDRPMVFSVTEGPSGAELLKSALRTALPQQLPLQAVFDRFSGIVTSSSGTPSAIGALLKQLFQILPSDTTIALSDKFKQALSDSGLFLEHKLGADASPSRLNKDLKANLLRLLSALNQSGDDGVSDITRHVEAALARIQLHQLTALTQEHTSSAWAGELPIRHDNGVDVLQFRIERDSGQTTDADKPSWNTWLSINLQNLGPLHAKITLGKQTLSTTFWAEMTATAELVNQHLETLRLTLQQAGLEVKDLQCRLGSPPFLPPSRFPNGLLDITA